MKRRQYYKWMIPAFSVFLFACSSEATKVVPQTEELPHEEATESVKDILDHTDVRCSSTVLEYSDKQTDPLKLVKVDDKNITITVKDQIDLKTVGDQEITYVLHYGDVEKEVKKTFTVKDTKAPVITLIEQTKTIEYGETYNPASNIKTVSDPVDGDLSYSEEGTGYRFDGSYDVNEAGTYELKVVAVDQHGNESSDTFTLTVKEAPEPEPEPVAAAVQSEPRFDYIGNANSKIFHYADCRSVKSMKDKNKVPLNDYTRDEAIAAGFRPCNICNP